MSCTDFDYMYLTVANCCMISAYGLYTGRISNNDCNTAGAILDPYGGVTGSQCNNNPASCQVGDLSGKHGDAKIISGGAGTGYFAAK